jgi:hypothetical protein
MKKTIILVLLIFLLIGCSKKGTEIKTDNYYFKIAGQDITMGQEAKDFLTAVGKPIDSYSSPSCAFEGDDTVYVYSGYQVTTFVSEGVEKFTGIYLNDNTVSTKEGIHIGSSYDDMIAAYGDKYVETYGAYTYSLGLTDLSFVIVGKTVTSISYLYAVQ